MAGPTSHIANLVTRYAKGRSVKEVERAAGLKQGALGYYLKPSSTTRKSRVPELAVMERFAAAYGADLDEVSQAFIMDAQLATGGHYTPDELDLIRRYRQMDEIDRARMREIFDAFERHAHSDSQPC